MLRTLYCPWHMINNICGILPILPVLNSIPTMAESGKSIRQTFCGIRKSKFLDLESCGINNLAIVQ